MEAMNEHLTVICLCGYVSEWLGVEQRQRLLLFHGCWLVFISAFCFTSENFQPPFVLSA